MHARIKAVLASVVATAVKERPAPMRSHFSFTFRLAVGFLLCANFVFAQDSKVLTDEIVEDRIERHAFHILVDTSEFAANLKRQIDGVPAAQRFMKFKDLASRFSKDYGSASQGGDLGWMVYSALGRPFTQVLFTQPLGAVSEPTATQLGWHLIYADGERPATDAGRRGRASIQRPAPVPIDPMTSFLRSVEERLSNRWAYIGHGSGTAVFGARDWTNLGDGRRSRWFIWAHTTPQAGNVETGYRPWSSSRALIVFDCKRRSTGRKQQIYYAGQIGDGDTVGSISVREQYFVMDEVAPETLGEMTLQDTCRLK